MALWDQGYTGLSVRQQRMMDFLGRGRARSQSPRGLDSALKVADLSSKIHMMMAFGLFSGFYSTPWAVILLVCKRMQQKITNAALYARTS